MKMPQKLEAAPSVFNIHHVHFKGGRISMVIVRQPRANTRPTDDHGEEEAEVGLKPYQYEPEVDSTESDGCIADKDDASDQLENTDW